MDSGQQPCSTGQALQLLPLFAPAAAPGAATMAEAEDLFNNAASKLRYEAYS